MSDKSTSGKYGDSLGSPEPQVLVSILSYNSPKCTVEAVESFRSQKYCCFHLQVIDNGSTTDCGSWIQQSFPDVEIMRLDSNLGYTGGNNLALERGLRHGFDYVLVSNDDVVVSPDTLGHLVETGQANSDAGVIGAVEVDYGSGNVRTTGGTRFPDWRFRVRWPVDHPDGGRPWHRVLFVQGSLVMFARRALEKDVRFDDNLFMYWDEIELGYALKAKGLSAYVDRRVKVRHRNKPASLTIRGGYLQQRNRVYLARKRFSSLKSFVYLCYSTMLEIPAKVLLRTAQGYPRFALACLLGHWDGLAGRLGKGRVEKFPEAR